MSIVKVPAVLIDRLLSVATPLLKNVKKGPFRIALLVLAARNTCTGPPIGATLPNPSSALTVRLKGVPAVTVAGGWLVTTSCVGRPSSGESNVDDELSRPLDATNV